MQHYTARLSDLEGLLRDAEVAYTQVVNGDRVSGQAVAALLKRREDLTREIHDIRERVALAEEAARPMSEDDVIRAAIEDLAALPSPLLDRVLTGLVEAGRGDCLRRCAPAGLYVVGD